MKWLVYKFCTDNNPSHDPVLHHVRMQWTPENEERAAQEAFDGVVTIEDDGLPDTLSISDRLEALERGKAPDPYVPGVWHYRGDRVTHEGAVYTCIAPAGQVCTWSPTEYPQYWSKEE